MRFGAIDIGTNSVLMLVVETRAAVPVAARPLLDLSTITRLGQGVDAHGRLDPEAVERTLACLRDYARRLERLRVDRLAVVSTSAARDADGVGDFAQRVKQILGVELQVISGQHEAQLACRGALGELPFEGAVGVCDVGGGSTEIVQGMWMPDRKAAERFAIERAMSLNIGAVRLTERHLNSDPPGPEQIQELEAYVESLLSSSLGVPLAPALARAWVGIGGTITTLASMELGLATYDSGRVHGFELTVERVRALLARLRSCSLRERQKIVGLNPKRADVILAGACIVLQVMQWAGISKLAVSDRGVRWALVDELQDAAGPLASEVLR